MNASRWQKIADIEYERLADTKVKFDIDDVFHATVAALRDETVSTELIEDYAWQLTRVADKKKTSRVHPGQYNLLTGEVEALNAIWPLGDGTRTRARKARRTEMLAWLGLRGENAMKVIEAYEADRQTVAALLVYMDDEQITVEDAVQAYLKDKRERGGGQEAR